MDDAEINNDNIDQEDQVIIRESPEPPPDPEPAHRFDAEGFRLLKDPDQHAADKKAAQYKEEFNTVDEFDPGKSGIGFLKHQSVFKHNENNCQSPHDIETIYPVFIVGVKQEKIFNVTDGGVDKLHRAEFNITIFLVL